MSIVEKFDLSIKPSTKSLRDPPPKKNNKLFVKLYIKYMWKVTRYKFLRDEIKFSYLLYVLCPYGHIKKLQSWELNIYV